MLKLDPIERVSFVLSAGSVGAAYALATPGFAAGVAVGAAIEAANLRVQVRAARGFFAGSAAGGANGWVASFSVRFIAMGLALLAALKLGTDPLGLLVGLSLAMPAVVFWAWRNRPPIIEQDAVEALAPDDPSWDRWSVWQAKELQPDWPDEDSDPVARQEHPS